MDEQNNMLQLIEHGIQINDDIKNGVEFVSIKDYQTVLNAYIETLYLLDSSHERFNTSMCMLERSRVRYDEIVTHFGLS